MSIFGKAFGRLVDVCTLSVLKKRRREDFTEEVAQTSENRAAQRPRPSEQQSLVAPEFQWPPTEPKAVDKSAPFQQRELGAAQQERTPVPTTPAFAFSPGVVPVRQAQRAWPFSRVKPAWRSPRNQRAYERGFYGAAGPQQGPRPELQSPWFGGTSRLPTTQGRAAASIPGAEPWHGPVTPYDQTVLRNSSRLTPSTFKVGEC
jgi:hypothetical protein